MASSVPIVAPQQKKEDDSNSSSTRRSSFATMISQTVSSATSSSSNTSPTNSSSTTQSSKPAANDDGVKKLLAMRLESLLEENVRIKEKVSMLESIVQDLTEELNDAKEAKALGLDDSNKDVITGNVDDGFEGTVDEDDVESFDI